MYVFIDSICGMTTGSRSLCQTNERHALDNCHSEFCYARDEIKADFSMQYFFKLFKFDKKLSKLIQPYLIFIDYNEDFLQALKM